MRVLVTGGRGQLGLSLKRVQDEGKRTEGEGDNNVREGIDFTFVDLPEVDITQGIDVGGFDAVINCAAWTDVDGAESHPEEAMRVNCNGAGMVARAAAGAGIPMVHISTDYVFDGSATEPIAEDDIPNPQGVYGVTKLAGEEAVKKAGCKAAIIRTAWLYSEFGNNFVRTMLRLGREGKSLRVVDDQRGCPTYAVDLAKAIITLLKRGVEGFEIYNYCGAGETTWYDFAREIFRQAGMEVSVTPVSTEEYGAKAPRPAYSVLLTAKIEAAGVKVMYWEDSLKSCLCEIS